MLQAALLLLGVALSRYLWEVDITIASVVLGVTSLGVIFYIFIIIAGTASNDCPYQTPFSRIFRYVPRLFFHHAPRLILNGIPPPFLPLIRLSYDFAHDFDPNPPPPPPVYQFIGSRNMFLLWEHFPLRVFLFIFSLLLIIYILAPLLLAVEFLVLVLLLLGLLAFKVCHRLFRGVGRHSFISTASRTPSSDQPAIRSDLRCIVRSFRRPQLKISKCQP